MAGLSRPSSRRVSGAQGSESWPEKEIAVRGEADVPKGDHKALKRLRDMILAQGSGSLPDRGSVITRSAIWRGYLPIRRPPKRTCEPPPTYLSEGLASVPPIHARNDLRNDKNRDGDSRAAS